jgi:hypothetical protein
VTKKIEEIGELDCQKRATKIRQENRERPGKLPEEIAWKRYK